jgi:MFS family permease
MIRTQSKRVSYYAFLLAIVLIWIPGMSVYMILPLYFTDLGFSTAQAGILMALGTLPGAFSALLGGWLSDRIGRKPVLLFGFFIYSSCFFLYVFRDFGFLALTRFIAGLSFYTTPGVATALLLDIFPPERKGQASGMYHSAQSIGGFVGPLIAGPIITAYSYEAYFLSCTISVFIGAVIVLLFVPESLTKKDRVAKSVFSSRPQLKGLGSSLRQTGRPLSILYFSMFLQSLGQSGIAPLLSIYIRQRVVGITLDEMSILYSVPNLLTSIISPFAGRLSDKIGRKKPLIASVLLASAVQLLYIPISNFTSVLAVKFAQTAVNAFTFPISRAFIADLLIASGGRSRLGAGLGVYEFISNETSTVGATYSGYVVDAYGFNSLFGIAGAMAFISSTVLTKVPEPRSTTKKS